jgi:hypothetical protein
MEEYLTPSTKFFGRGIQYYLGFHHARHFCRLVLTFFFVFSLTFVSIRGWIPTTDSHYMSQLLGYRNTHAFFLGCPMTENIINTVSSIINGIENNVSGIIEIVKVSSSLFRSLKTLFNCFLCLVSPSFLGRFDFSRW